VNPYLELNRVMTQKRISADKMFSGGSGGGSSGNADHLVNISSGLMSPGATAAAVGEGGDDASSSIGGSSSSLAGAGAGAGAGGGSKDASSTDHNMVSFGKWFFFCQHCRHGGHANCIDQWFGGSGNILHSTALMCEPCGADGTPGRSGGAGGNDAGSGLDGGPLIGARKRTVCGVNGCDCHCIARL
jgi:hypothetical protein